MKKAGKSKEKDGKKEEKEKAKKEDKPKGKPVPLPDHIKGKVPTYKLKGNFPKIETKMDELLKYIYDRRSVSLGKASRKFDVERTVMEEWGEILEESGLIEMHYPVIGQPMLRIPIPKTPGKKPKAKEKEKKPGGIRPKRFVIYAEIAAILSLVIYIFLIDQSLSENFIPTLQSYLEFLIANPVFIAAMLVAALVPVIVLKATGKPRNVKEHHGKGSEEKGKGP